MTNNLMASRPLRSSVKSESESSVRVPKSDWHLYAKLRDAAKREYELLADCIAELSGTTRGLSALYRKWAARLHCSPNSIRRKYDAWRRGTAEYPAGDWRILINKSLAGKMWSRAESDRDTDCLPEEFKDYVRMLAGQHQRKTRPALRALRRQLNLWRTGQPWTLGDKGLTYWKIPGYATPPPCARGSTLPRGWSERNLYRLLREPDTQVQIVMARIGSAAALQKLPPIPGTRAGLRFLEYVLFDDLWQDRKVLVPGHTSPARLLQLGCLDLASGYYLHSGQRPELPTESGVRERLKERDMRWLVASFLEKYGFPSDYDMHLVLEHGTATLREADAQALHNWSGGRIHCCYTTLEGGLVHVWDESVRGNPRGKAAIESWHNIFHNEAALLRGQVGQDRDHSPAILAAQEREARDLAIFSCFLPQAEVGASRCDARLNGPFSSLHEAHFQTLEVIALINARTDHRCEGFDTTFDWRINGVEMPLQPASRLPEFLAQNPHFAEHLRPGSIASQSLIEYFPRLESPTERYQRLSAAAREREFIEPGLLCTFYQESRRKLKLEENGTFAFIDDGRQYTFAPDGAALGPINLNTDYLVYYPPADPERIHITTLDGAYVATWSRVQRVTRGTAAAVAAFREKQRHFHRVATGLARVHGDFIEAEQNRQRQNEARLAEAHLLSAMDCAGTDGALDRGAAAKSASSPVIGRAPAPLRPSAASCSNSGSESDPSTINHQPSTTLARAYAAERHAAATARATARVLAADHLDAPVDPSIFANATDLETAAAAAEHHHHTTHEPSLKDIL